MINSFYSPEMRNFVRGQPWPKRLIWEIVEFEDCLKLKFYRDNINSLTGDEKLHLAKIANEVLSAIHKTGIPIYTWVEAGTGESHGRRKNGLDA